MAGRDGNSVAYMIAYRARIAHATEALSFSLFVLTSVLLKLNVHILNGLWCDDALHRQKNVGTHNLIALTHSS